MVRWCDTSTRPYVPAQVINHHEDNIWLLLWVVGSVHRWGWCLGRGDTWSGCGCCRARGLCGRARGHDHVVELSVVVLSVGGLTCVKVKVSLREWTADAIESSSINATLVAIDGVGVLALDVVVIVRMFTVCVTAAFVKVHWQLTTNILRRPISTASQPREHTYPRAKEWNSVKHDANKRGVLILNVLVQAGWVGMVVVVASTVSMSLTVVKGVCFVDVSVLSFLNPVSKNQ